MGKLEFLNTCSKNKVLEQLAELSIIPSKTVRNVNMYFKYESWLRSGLNVNSAVFMTARHFNLDESTVYKIVKKIERELDMSDQ